MKLSSNFRFIKNSLYKAFVIAGLLIIAAPALAQSDAVKNAREEMLQSIDKLSEIKEQELAPEEKILREIEAKKLALGKIIDLSILETQDIKNKIETLTEVEAEFVIMRDVFLENINDYLDHFLGIKNTLEIATSLEAVQKIAGDFKDWRENVYNPEVKKFVDFILIFQNKSILKIADQRFNKISLELKKIKSVKLKPDSWQLFLTEAALNLKEARNSNSQAMILLAAYIPKEEPVVANLEGAEEATIKEVPQEKTFTEQDQIMRNLIQASLINIKEAYQNFIGLSDLVKKSLK